LVVAADDGVMPQTVEAFDHAKTANVPIVVAINKIDKPNSNIEMTKQQLASKLGLVPEDWGGDTITVPISALNGQGIDELLEMVLLVAEMNEIRCVPEGPARGVIVESRLDKAVGPLANAIVKDGILKRGDYLVAGSTLGKVKALIDETGKRVKEAKPSEPIQILGFDEVPDVHEIMYVVETLDQAREVKESAEKKESKESMIKGKKGVKLEEFAKTSEGEETKTLNLIIKADSFGTVEALKQSVARLETEEVHIEVIHSGIGSINSSDVMLAAASNAVILGFNVKPNSEARKDAEVEDVQIRTYDIIFELIDDLKKALEGLLEPEEVDETTGHGEVKEVFRIKKVGYIAGVQMIDGHVQKKGEVRVYRNGEEIHDGPIETLKHYKDDVSRIEAPKECGIKLEEFEDIEKGDELEFHIKKQVRRTLDFNENQ
jgi:translation initiation factor IF-2